ncbi:MAG: RNA polymerase sigma factor [Tepidisphaerales bacterium]
MAEVAHGRAEQIEPLVRRYGTPLLTFIRHMVGDHHRSEELFQEVFLAVWTRRRQYRYPLPFKPWLYQIALNRCRQWLRLRRKPVRSLDDDPPRQFAMAGPSPQESAIAVETASLVDQVVALLPPRQHSVVVMRLWGGLAYAEIAAAMEVSEGTVRSNMHDALAFIRRHLLAPEGR